MSTKGLMGATCALAACVLVQAAAAPAGGLEGAPLVGELLPPMNFPHRNGGLAASGGMLYAWGGADPAGGMLDVLEVFDPADFQAGWSLLDPAPTTISGAGEFVLDGQVYSAGGETVPGGFTSDVYRFGPPGGNWSGPGEVAGLPSPMWDPVSVACDGKAYLMGGRRGYGRSYGEVYEYDPPGNSWTPKSDMPLSVRTTAAASYDDKVGVFGGLHNDSESSEYWTPKVQVYDPSANSWQYGDDMPETLGFSQAVTHGERIWVFSTSVADGGGGWTPNDHAWEFDPATSEWTRHELQRPAAVTSLITPIALIDDYVYFANGVDDGQLATPAYRVRVSETVRVPGDANCDGVVDDLDLTALATHWQLHGGWPDGDFSGDGFVADADLAILAAAWPSGGGGAPGNVSAVPGPATLSLLLVGGPALLRSKRR